ncbi:MAG: hypothetical protein BHW55_01895 [Candidatus Melainabacteria bacterium 35_41]|jgi:hypothetical protein|nr:MAG: hypothetical protein BHW55_01895 [Candidatus Melainabacteria bacterium 35_41]
MRNITAILGILLTMFVFTQSLAVAQTDKVKFDKQTYNLESADKKNNEYNYYLKGETPENWHSKITLTNFPDLTNATEAAAELAHKIQEENHGASVLVYPDAAMIGLISFPASKDYYEYNTILFQPAKTKGLDKFKYAKRFYSSENNGQEGARKAAIEFAEKNNTKYMEMVSKEAPKYKVD